ncbi:hypothetical protein [Actinomadura violacea]|uniref:Uncharacterized protein n=1 Tax=Actinomadura violacea TaxID=2819934 RepID=A0ABS3RHH8_9ACTN|nr:hypothetical protein [Actinomadura violacea]MBO2456180.1 hypothetical protein [Actinomadura violacea]
MTGFFAMPPAFSSPFHGCTTTLPGGGFFMRANNPDNNPVPPKKKARKGKPDFRSASFANNRRNAGRAPTRQFNRGR